MSQTTKIANAPQGELTYNAKMLKDLMNRFGVKPRTVMSIFGQTNPTTINNWMGGGEIYFGALVAICNAFELDPLRFVNYAGQAFRSSIVDLYRLESLGISVGDILRERGIETYEEYQGTHALRSQADIEADAETRKVTDERVKKQYESYLKRQETAQRLQLSATEVIEKVSEIQREAFRHEQDALDHLRAQKDMEISARDQTIMNLRVLLARMGYQGFVADENHPRAVADGSEAQETPEQTEQNV